MGLRLLSPMFGAACAMASEALVVSLPTRGLALRVKKKSHICSVLAQAPDAQLYWHTQMDVPWSRAELLEDRLRSQASTSGSNGKRQPELVSGPKSFSRSPRKEIMAPLPEDVRTVVTHSTRAAAQAVDSWITRKVAHQLPEDVASGPSRQPGSAPSSGINSTLGLQPTNELELDASTSATKPAVAAALQEGLAVV